MRYTARGLTALKETVAAQEIPRKRELFCVTALKNRCLGCAKHACSQELSDSRSWPWVAFNLGDTQNMFKNSKTQPHLC